ncbi:ATP-binding cassette domain-containing protein [Nanchangia anserum]|uniref:ABC transporter ATP-binding protein n=1 Tax=Nanchangia anserum TaxID=2692125 RepID=A0A8I0KU27_9ACTO|nr:ABC transporter ATP-binding protein [Nanchangia anserum]
MSETRPVLAPLTGSILARILDHVLGCVLYGLAAGAAVGLATQVPGPSWGVLGALIAAMVLLCLVKGLCHYAEQFLGHSVAFRALELLRRACFVRLIPASPAALAGARSGDLLARLTTDIDRIEVFFAHTIAPAISAIVVPLLACTAIGVVGGVQAGAAGLAIVVITLLVCAYAGHDVARVASLSNLGAKGDVAQQLTDSVQGVAEVVGYGVETARLSSLAEAQDRVRVQDARLTRVLAVRRGVVQVGLLAMVVAPTALAVRAGAAAWAVAAIAVVAWRSWEVVRGVEDFSTSLATSLAAARRVHTLVHTPPAVADGPDTRGLTRAPEVVWDRVTFAYPPTPGRAAAAPVVREATVRAPAGKWTAFVGATGAGKSTLLALALRYWDPQSGCMRMDGTDIRGYRVEALRRRIAVVDQRPHLFTGTIASNLRLVAPAASDDELWAALDAAQLGEDVRRMGGLEARVGERAATLSGGQAQRLALARAFLVDAHLVVLDEFTSHLDPELADRVRASVREIFPDATILEVTHTAPADALSQRDAGIDRLVVVGEGGIDEAASLST